MSLACTKVRIDSLSDTIVASGTLVETGWAWVGAGDGEADLE